MQVEFSFKEKINKQKISNVLDDYFDKNYQINGEYNKEKECFLIECNAFALISILGTFHYHNKQYKVHFLSDYKNIQLTSITTDFNSAFNSFNKLFGNSKKVKILISK